MGEIFYLFGCMLLLMDHLIPGPVREKMLVSYIRYKDGQNSLQKINEVTKLCKSTGFTIIDQECKAPKDYPLEYFQRFSVNCNWMK